MAKKRKSSARKTSVKKSPTKTKRRKTRSKPKKKNMFSASNIILGVIILVLVISLFVDFSKKMQDGFTPDDGATCPQDIPGIVVTNVAYGKGDTFFDPDRCFGEEEVEGNATVSLTVINRGEKQITISALQVNPIHLGQSEQRDIDDIVVKPGERNDVVLSLESCDIHKLDLLTYDPCDVIRIWHDHIGHDYDCE